MKSKESVRHVLNLSFVLVVLITLAAACSNQVPTGSNAAEVALLEGRVVSSTGEALAGIPIRAHREDSNITVSVYTNGQGEYSFPDWSDLVPGAHSISTTLLPEYEPVKPQSVTLSAGQTSRLDLTLKSREPHFRDVTATDIMMGLPGTDDQKVLAIQCDNCHSMQWTLKDPHTKDQWRAIVRRMAGRGGSRDTPGTRFFRQKQYIEPLADYFTSIRGPGSSDQLPFKLRPRPTEDAALRLVVTEYDIPRGGNYEPYLLRADRRYAWPHDIIVDENYGYYTDHYSDYFGRLDKRTGVVKEYAFSPPPDMQSEGPAPAQISGTARPRAGTHDILFDSKGRPVFGRRELTIRFDPQTEEFDFWPVGGGMFGLDPQDGVWIVEDEGLLSRLDTNTGEVQEYHLPAVDGIYDHEVDGQGRSIIYVWGEGSLRLFDPKTGEHTDYPTPTPGSGPRRGDWDSMYRQWLGLYFAGRLARFDPNTGEIKEYPLVAGSQPFGPPFASPYSAAVDEKNQLVWTTDFNSSRIFLFDMQTEKFTEFFMPGPYEVRDLTVDKFAERPTLWIPAYRAPAKMVKVQLR